MKKSKVFLGIGTNLGELSTNIEQTKIHLELHVGKITKISSNYKTKALDFHSENDFLNLVIEIATELTPSELLKATQKIEKSIGRDSKSINGIHSDRIIDIDILYYNQEKINLPDLVIPHPKLKERKFVLVPIVEIAPNFIDPSYKHTMLEMLIKCPDVSNIIKIK